MGLRSNASLPGKINRTGKQKSLTNFSFNLVDYILYCSKICYGKSSISGKLTNYMF